MNMRLKFVPLRSKYNLLLFGALLSLYYFISPYLWNDQDLINTTIILEEPIYYSLQNDTDCQLPRLKIWHPEIRKIYGEFVGSKPEECTVKLNQMTSLEKGHLRVNWERGLFSLFAPLCYYRCLYHKDDWNLIEGEWHIIDNAEGAWPKCDVIETQCQKYFSFNYRFMHTQFVEKPPTVNLTHSPSPYNLYWIIIDATSHSMFKRAMLKTEKVLMDKMEAIEFSHLNKIGRNSRPNSYGMFFDLEYEKMETKLVFNKNLNEWEDFSQICREPMDNLSFVGYDFQREGFRTMMTEDWSSGVLNWFDCIGFAKAPVDHYMRPFWLKIGINGERKHIDTLMQYQMYEQSCRREQFYDLEHLLQFADSYKYKPKFAITWITELAHHKNSVLFKVDNQFAEFFEKLNELSKNSFIFIEADHGKHYGQIRDVPLIGEAEDKNPFLYVVVPEKLRKNPTFMQQIKENSKHLVSQFDLYASAVQIAKFSHIWTPTTLFNQAPNQIPNRSFLGSSIFHKMPQPRSCSTLNIPDQWCICQVETKILDDLELGIRVAQLTIDSINKQLDESKHKNDCLRHKLSPNYKIQLEEVKQQDKRILKARFETLPGKALYQGAAEIKNDGSIKLTQTQFPRLNSYRDQAHCIPQNFFKNYCVCKN